MSATRFRHGDEQHSTSRGREHNGPPIEPYDVAERLKQLECDPIAAMVALARNEAAPLSLRAKIFADLASYIAPRRKAVELSGKDGGPISVEESLDLSGLSDAELDTMIALYTKATGGNPL